MIELTSCETQIDNGCNNEVTSFPRISNSISYEEFFRQFLEKNRPCVLSSSFTEGWPARTDWVTPSSTPDVSYFQEHFGEFVRFYRQFVVKFVRLISD